MALQRARAGSSAQIPCAHQVVVAARDDQVAVDAHTEHCLAVVQSRLPLPARNDHMPTESAPPASSTPPAGSSSSRKATQMGLRQQMSAAQTQPLPECRQTMATPAAMLATVRPRTATPV